MGRDYADKKRDYDRDRERNRDRRDRDRDRDRRPKDHTSDISKMKDKMRSGLENARKYESTTSEEAEGSSSRPFKIEIDLTGVEQTARVKEIERIEEGGFQPAAFKSTAGGAGGRVYGGAKKPPKKELENSHDSAIFGPAWKSADHSKKKVDLGEVKLPPPPIEKHVQGNANAPMIPTHMLSENVEKRKQAWFEYWKSQRQELLSSRN